MAANRKSKRVRAPAETRRKILEAAFEEFYMRGFQAASVDGILAKAGVTKGAIYHHFSDKTALGYAVLEELVCEGMLQAYLVPLEQATGDPLDALQHTLRRRADDFIETGVALGCPVNNLAQEMSPLDEGFRLRAAAGLDALIDAFADAIERAKRSGSVRADVDARRIAAFVVAAVEGSFGMAKNANDVAVLRSNLETMADFLEGLRPRRAVA